jgi:hypothetical protein
MQGNAYCTTQLGEPATCTPTGNSAFGNVCQPVQSCQTGDCGGVAQCVPGHGANGNADLAEFTLQNNQDYYDVSIINGINVPMSMGPAAAATASPAPDQDPKYYCTTPGSATDFGLGACNWSGFKPSFTSNTNPPVATDYSALMRLVVPPSCSSSNPCPAGMTCTNDAGGYCATTGIIARCLNTLSPNNGCPSGYTCTDPVHGGVCYVPCTSDADCAG